MTLPSADRRSFLRTAALGALAAGAAAPRAARAGPAAAPRGEFLYALNTGTIRGQNLPLPEQIETAAKAGFGGIEPWVSDVRKYAESGGDLDALRKRLADLNVRVVGGITFANWVVDDDAQRAKGVEQLKAEMDLLARIGASHIAAPPAGATKADGPRLDLDRAAGRYRAILEIGRQTGVVPQLEFWGASANLNGVASAAYVAAQSGHPDACVLADAFHMYKGGSPAASVGILGPRAVHAFHMNDYPANPSRETIRDADRIWPGDGIAPLKEILAAFAANGCRMWLSVELFNAEYWKLPALEAARTGLAKMRAVVSAAGLA